MIRVTFSDNRLEITGIPSSWSELSAKELEMVYQLMSDRDSESLALTVLCRLTGIRIIREAAGGFICAVPLSDGETAMVTLSPEILLSAVEVLDWLKEPGNVPVRIPSLRGHTAVDARLHGVSFGDYISVENNLQGYLATQNSKALAAVAAKLYPGFDQSEKLTESECINIFNWCAQIKAMFSDSFANFFKPGGDGGADAMSMLEIMNTEIRALTGGDLTKEEAVLEADCWRALTELDFKAKEAEEFNAQMAKYKK